MFQGVFREKAENYLKGVVRPHCKKFLKIHKGWSIFAYGFSNLHKVQIECYADCYMFFLFCV